MYYFVRKTRQMGQYLHIITYGHQLQVMTHFMTNEIFDPDLYNDMICLETHFFTFILASVIALINDLKKSFQKKLIDRFLHHLVL